MSENFFLDNPDLQFRLEHLDLREVLELKEKGFAESELYPTAPRNYADATDNFRIVLEVLGEICGERVAPRAAEADEEGAHYESGEVTYAAATRDAIGHYVITRGPFVSYFRKRFVRDLRDKMPDVFMDTVSSSQFLWFWSENDSYESDAELKDFVDRNYVLTRQLVLAPGSKAVRIFTRR